MGGQEFYKEASGIVKKILAKKGTIKQLCYHCRHANKKKMFAVVSEVLLYYPVLSDILDSTQLLQLERALRSDRTLTLILLHDHVWNPRGIQCGGPYKALLRRHKSRIASDLVLWQLRHGLRANTGATVADTIKAHFKALAKTVQLPRYIRVNLAQTQVDAVVQHFCENDGYALVDAASSPDVPVAKTLYRDPDLPDVLVLPPSIDLHAHPLFLNGHIVLQDKASCLPAHLLLEGFEKDAVAGDILDACAAPGNKTTHLASLVAAMGKGPSPHAPAAHHITALDMDGKRVQTLQTNITRQGLDKHITALHQDFLAIDPTTDPRFQKVTHVLLDPSCSGSGMVQRMNDVVQRAIDHDRQRPAGTPAPTPGNPTKRPKKAVHTRPDAADPDADDTRLTQLAAFQLAALRHALTAFPRLRRLTYSTCSVHGVENEAVVRQALATQPRRPGIAGGPPRPTFRVVAPRCVPPGASSAGLDAHLFGKAAPWLQLVPEQSKTHGFFVACFERIDYSDDEADDV